ncbi:MAG: hypothetical protein QM778_18305 [Myxococcales bacterium]
MSLHGRPESSGPIAAFVGQVLATLGLATFLAVAALLPCHYARADDASTAEVEHRATGCKARIADIKAEIRETESLANIYLIAGAALAAIGSALAGFLDKISLRRVAGVAGAVGAVVSVLPKTLPDLAELNSRLMRADRHWTTGDKVQAQLSLLDSSVRNACEKYAIARFVDCASESAPENVPELPSFDGPENTGESDIAMLPVEATMGETKMDEPKTTKPARGPRRAAGPAAGLLGPSDSEP